LVISTLPLKAAPKPLNMMLMLLKLYFNALWLTCKQKTSIKQQLIVKQP
jgi:hypothetical protein